MTYLQTHNRPYQRAKQAFILTVAFVVIIVIVIQFSAPHAFPTLFTAMARPFWRVEFSAESGALDSFDALLKEKESLTRQLAEAQVRLDTIRAVELENVELKSVLGRGDLNSIGTSTGEIKKNLSTLNNLGILAAVLKHPPISLYDELIIDIGHDHKISTSSLTYVSGNVLVGRVVDVLAFTSKVRLFSSAGESYPVLIGSTRIAATAIGRGGGQYEAQVSRDMNVNDGDFVLNAGLNDRPFGVVSGVLLDPTLPFKTVLFAPPVNMYQLRWVLVKN